MKSPIIFRKTLEKEVRHHKARIREIEIREEEKREELSKQLDDFIPKLFRISFSKNINYNTYRIAIDFEARLIEECFIHGDSQFMIEHLSHRLARQIKRELLQINFQRLPRY